MLYRFNSKYLLMDGLNERRRARSLRLNYFWYGFNFEVSPDVLYEGLAQCHKFGDNGYNEHNGRPQGAIEKIAACAINGRFSHVKDPLPSCGCRYADVYTGHPFTFR